MRTVHCTKCERDLPVDAFRLSRITPTTKNDQCRKCKSDYARAWNLAHPERVRKSILKHRPRALVRMSEWNRANREYLTEYMRKWREENREHVRETGREAGRRRRARYPDEVGAYQAEQRARKRAHTPSWANMAAIRAVYAKCRRLSKTTGIPHHVDHIIPLKGENVSGLHVETNLQILTASENCRKRNTVMEAAY